MQTRTFLFLILISSPGISDLAAHQPVMDMAPRWSGGYGAQTRYEFIEQKSSSENSDLTTSTLHKLWLEGIYTFKREHRVTLKIPTILKSTEQTDVMGLGDIILGFPNKLYFNRRGITGNMGLTPSLKLPTGDPDEPDKLGTGTFDFGGSLSGSIETLDYYTLLDFYGQWTTEADNNLKHGNAYGWDFDLGWHPYRNVQKSIGTVVLVSLNGKYLEPDKIGNRQLANSGGFILEVAPGFLYHQENIMIKTSVHFPILEDLRGSQITDAYKIQVGFGVVY